MSRWEQFEVWTISAAGRQWVGSFADLDVAAAMARSHKERILLLRVVYDYSKRLEEEVIMEIGLPRAS
jgi:hypothetical protein